jgi:hypothetical protein
MMVEDWQIRKLHGFSLGDSPGFRVSLSEGEDPQANADEGRAHA